MTAQDRAEIRQMLSDVLLGHSEEMKGRFNVIHANLIQIKEQTTKTNGRVNALEDEVEALQKSDNARLAVLKFMGKMWIIAVGFVGLVIAVIELLIKP